MRIDGHVEAVWEVANAGTVNGFTQYVGPECVTFCGQVRIALSQHQRPEIAPALAHAAALQGIERIRVGSTAGQAIGDAMTEFVDNDLVVEITVPFNSRDVPDKHPHPATLSVGWCLESSVVCDTEVGSGLDIGNDLIIAQTTLAVIIELEVARFRIKTISRMDIVQHVVRIEQLCCGSIGIRQRVQPEVDREVKV